MSNPFFINNGPFNISEIFKILKIETYIKENRIVKDIQDLFSAEKIVLLFFIQKNIMK